MACGPRTWKRMYANLPPIPDYARRPDLVRPSLPPLPTHEYAPPPLTVCMVCCKDVGEGGSSVSFSMCRSDCAGVAHTRCIRMSTWGNSAVDISTCPFCAHRNRALPKMESIAPTKNLPPISQRPRTIGQGITLSSFFPVVYKMTSKLVQKGRVGSHSDFDVLVRSLNTDLEPPLNMSKNAESLFSRVLGFINHITHAHIRETEIGLSDLRACGFGELDVIHHFNMRDPDDIVALEVRSYGTGSVPAKHTEPWSAAISILVQHAMDVHSLREYAGLDGMYMARTGVRASHLLVPRVSIERLILFRISTDLLMQMGMTREDFFQSPFSYETWRNDLQMRLEHIVMLGINSETVPAHSSHTLERISRVFVTDPDAAARIGFGKVGLFCQ